MQSGEASLAVRYHTDSSCTARDAKVREGCGITLTPQLSLCKMEKARVQSLASSQ